MTTVTSVAGPTLLVGGAVLLLTPEFRPVCRLLHRFGPAARTVEAELDRVGPDQSAATWEALPKTRALLGDLTAGDPPPADATANVEDGRLLADGVPVCTPECDPVTVDDVKTHVTRRYRRRVYGLGVAAMGLGIFLQWWGYVATA